MFFQHPDDESGGLATEAEADAEYARNVGAERPEQAWILSDRDVWYRNPAYTGPAVPHPEDYDPAYDDEVTDLPETEGDHDLAHAMSLPGDHPAHVAALDDGDDDIPW